MNNVISTDNERLGWQGARLAAVSVVIGSIVFVLMDTLPLVIDNLSALDITGMIILAILASLLSLPFSIMGGYFLGWFFQKTRWYKQSTTKVVVSGAIIASVTLVIIFVIAGFFQACIGSHGKCEEDFLAYATQLVIRDLSFSPLTRLGYLFIVRFIKALFIAAVCGGITAWRLSRVAQQKPA
jgi:hypothetical protein